MKVLMVLKNLDGGTGTYAKLFQQYYSKHFKNEDKNHFLIACVSKPQYFDSIKENLVVYKSIYQSNYRFVDIFFRFPTEFIWLKNIVTKYNPDIIINVNMHAIILVELLRWSMGLKTIITISTIHTNLDEVFKKRLSNQLLRKVVRAIGGTVLSLSDEVVAVSRELAVNVENFFKLSKKVVTIYNGVELLNNRASKSVKTNIGNTINILSVARLDTQKDFLTVLKALSSIRNKINFKYSIIGDGPEKAGIEKSIKALGLDDRVHIAGWKSRNELLKDFDLLIVSSFYEGLSYVILESMAAGLPVVASNCDFGPREILDNGKYGKLFPVGNSQMLSQILLNYSKAKESEKLYLSKLSLDRAKSFDIGLQMDNYSNLVESLCSQKNNRLGS